MDRSIQPFRIFIRLAVCALLAWPTLASAQAWEAWSGLSPHRESLRKAVDVRYCTGGGVASIGTQRVTSGLPGLDNIVVERVNPNNPLAGIWRSSYDSNIEQGGGIVEYTDGSGFAIVGSHTSTLIPGNHFIVSKIDCNGNMSWINSYGPSVGTVVAWDIIRANTGSGIAPFFTAPGDLIALGEYTLNGITRVRVARIRSNGQLIWLRDYAAPNNQSLLGRGIAEIETPSTTDELVIGGGVGGIASIFQISGEDGSFICGSQLPGLGLSRFNDIAAHGVPNLIAPGFTAVGETRTVAGALPQAFVASYRNQACALQNQVHWGWSNESETAQAVTTTRINTFSTVPIGQLLIAGNVTGPYAGVSSSSDAWAHLMVPIQLTAYTANNYTGQRFGTQAIAIGGAESAASIAESSNGAYLVGSTTSPWVAGDASNGYTVRMHSNLMRTACSVPWKAPITTLSANSPLIVSGPRLDPSLPLGPFARSSLNFGLCCSTILPP